MGLKATIQKVAKTAFGALGDIPITVSYIKTHDNGFDPEKDEDGNDIIVPPVTDSFLLVRAKFTDQDMRRPEFKFGELIRQKDVKGLVPTLSCSVELENGGLITCPDTGDVFSIEERAEDAANALHILLLRKP